MTPPKRFRFRQRLSRRQLALAAIAAVLTVAIGILALSVYFNIILTNFAFQGGYIITDLTDIQRAALLLRGENNRVLAAGIADFETLELRRGLLNSQLRLATSEVSGTGRVTDSLREIKGILVAYDAQLAVLKANPTPAEFAAIGPQLTKLMDQVVTRSREINNQEESRFFSTISEALQTQRASQTILLFLSGLLIIFSGILVFSVRRTVSGEFEVAYRQLETEVDERKRAQGALTRSHVELSEVNHNLQTLNFRLQRELNLARRIQESLLPPSRPDWPGLDAVFYTIPAYEVGGDFYAYHKLDDHHFTLAVGDVSGKGMSAALLMATTLAHFDSMFTFALSPSELLTRLDQALLRYTTSTRQNCALCYIEINNSTVYVANAGGITPYVRRARGGIEELQVGGLPLGTGIEDHAGYQTLRATLTPGDLIVLTSDGVVEANISTDNLFGFDRLEQAIETGPISSAQAMLSHLESEIAIFIKDGEPPDDVTIVVIQVES